MTKEDMGITARLQLEGPIDRLYELLAIINKINKQAGEPSGEAIKMEVSKTSFALPPDQPITEKMAKRLYAIAQSNDYSEAEMNSILESEFGYGSTWVVKNGHYEAVCARFANKA